MNKTEFEEFRDKLYEQAKAIGCCDLFTGEENIVELCNLVRTVDGFSYCNEHNFPSLAAWREFDSKFDASKYGIYIDKQEVELSNVEHPVLIGKTTANIHCDQLRGFYVTQLAGAHATIYAEKWSVIRTRCGKGCATVRRAKDKAIIL